jgi:mycofactocin precursor
MQEVRMAPQVTEHPAPLEAAATEELATDELLVEEVSIDGMCGVY